MFGAEVVAAAGALGFVWGFVWGGGRRWSLLGRSCPRRALAGRGCLRRALAGCGRGVEDAGAEIQGLLHPGLDESERRESNPRI